MYDVKQIRNTVILGHGNSGKTTLAEALLFTAGAISRLGKVDDGTASMDFEDEENKNGRYQSVQHVIIFPGRRSRSFWPTLRAMIIFLMRQNSPPLLRTAQYSPSDQCSGCAIRPSILSILSGTDTCPA